MIDSMKCQIAGKTGQENKDMRNKEVLCAMLICLKQ